MLAQMNWVAAKSTKHMCEKCFVCNGCLSHTGQRTKLTLSAWCDKRIKGLG